MACVIEVYLVPDEISPHGTGVCQLRLLRVEKLDIMFTTKSLNGINVKLNKDFMLWIHEMMVRRKVKFLLILSTYFNRALVKTKY